MKGMRLKYIEILGLLVCGCGYVSTERYTCLDLCEEMESDLEKIGIIDSCKDPIWHEDLECLECVDIYTTKFELEFTPGIPPCDEEGRYNHEFFENHNKKDPQRK